MHRLKKKTKQLNECVKAIIQNMKRCCICFSSSGAVILKVVGHAVTCVVVCQHFKDNNKKKIIASYEVRLISLILSNFQIVCTYMHTSVNWVAV